MKSYIILIPSIAVVLSGCQMLNEVNKSTNAIQRNRCAVERSTEAIEHNIDALEKITENLQEMEQ